MPDYMFLLESRLSPEQRAVMMRVQELSAAMGFNLYLTGGTLIIDHGLGLSSIFLHLSAIEVKVGDRVRQGQEVARMGRTGRVTGPHLHWGMNWQNVRLDPQLLVPPMPALPASAQAKPATGGGD